MKRRRNMRAKIPHTKCEYRGVQFDSKTEMRFYAEVLFPMHLAGEIKDIEFHKQFELIPAFEVLCAHCFGSGKQKSKKTGKSINCSKCKGAGRKQRSKVVYTCDFYVTYHDGNIHCIDVKGGFKNESFGLRKTVYESKFPDPLIIVTWDNKKREWVWKY